MLHDIKINKLHGIANGYFLARTVGAVKSMWGMLFRPRSARIFALTVTALMLCLTYVSWHMEQREESEKREKVFATAADHIKISIEQRLARHEITLRGVKGFYESPLLVTQRDYQNYIKGLKLGQPGLNVIAVAAYVPHAKQAQHLADMHLSGISDYRIKPSGQRAEYAPIALVESNSATNLSAIGFDVLSNPAAKKALALARDSGEMATTSRLKLIQDEAHDRPAVVMYMPIYDTRQALDTLAQRRAALIGWVRGPLRVGDLMDSLGDQLGTDLGIDIYEGDSVSTANRLYSNHDFSNELNVSAKFNTRRALDVGGQRWTLVLYGLPAFQKRFPAQNQLQFALFGAALSLLLGWVIWLLASGRERAVVLAHKMTQGLRAAELDLEGTLNAMPDLLFEFGLDGRCYNFRTSRQHQFSAPPDALIGRLISDVLPPQAATICLEALQEAHQQGFSSGKKIEVPIGAELHWFELSVARKELDGLEQPHFIMISREISDRVLAQNQLRIAAIAFESQQGMMVTDANSIILRVNKAFAATSGYSQDEVVGQTPSLFSSGRQDAHFYAQMWHSINHTGAWSGELLNRRKNGEIYPEHVTINAVKDAQDSVTNYVATLIDITLSKAASDEIKLLAFYDPLTNLPNRRLLVDRLTHALAASVRSARKGALLFLDLDHFKTLNDTLGHDFGDQLLQQVAARLLDCMREGDTVARIGGDEFLLILEDLDEQDLVAATETKAIVEKIQHVLRQPFELGIHVFHSTPSIGISLFDGQQFGVDDLLKQADIAMYEAKSSGRNTLRFFDPKMQEAIAKRVDLERELRTAIEQQQFTLHYQIQVNSSGLATGAEALIRWQHPQRGMISPFDFIPLAEETGLILPLGLWVLDTACAQLQAWQQDALSRDLILAINVSARQFLQEDFVAQVLAAVERHQINPNRLKLELTESTLVNNIDNIVTKMHALKTVGIDFSLDDFGTGYSSLQYLKLLPLNQLKIDQSFVRDIISDSSDRAIVRTIITMTQSLDIHVIAEGVETTEQQQFLLDNGCKNYQGYLYSKPLPLAAFEALLRQTNS